MKHVKYDDSNNEQDVLHGGEKVSSPLSECQEAQKAHKSQSGFDPKFSMCLRCLRAHGFEMMSIDVVTLDHAIESLAIDGQHARRGLLVAARMFEHTRNVTSLDNR